ncbi:hypothetical protein VS868_11825 [Salinimicrobium sp. 3283s]|uniref:hypothetical protein n=1 Tax=Salinimicrobium sp. 3283s TaxID=3114359 RepID=UPI0031EFB838
MNFYKSNVSQIPNGPGGKDLNFLSGEEKITKEEAEKIFDDFFNSDADNSARMKVEAWKHLESGVNVTLGDVCISIKKK